MKLLLSVGRLVFGVSLGIEPRLTETAPDALTRAPMGFQPNPSPLVEEAPSSLVSAREVGYGMGYKQP